MKFIAQIPLFYWQEKLKKIMFVILPKQRRGSEKDRE